MAQPAAGSYSVSLAAIPRQPKTALTVEFRGAALFLRFMPCVPIFLPAGLSPLDLGQAVSDLLNVAASVSATKFCQRGVRWVQGQSQGGHEAPLAPVWCFRQLLNP